MPPEWIRVDRPELEIDGNDSTQVLVNFRPARRSDTKPGDYSVTIRVAPKDNPEAKVEAHLTVHILAFSGFGMALESDRVASGGRFRLYLHNQGSAPLPLTVSGRDTSGKLRFIIPGSKVSLMPGQRMVVQGEVKPLRPALVGKPRQHPFDLIV